MRVLATIPHFYRYSSEGTYQSETAEVKTRAAIVARCVAALHQTVGQKQRIPGARNDSSPANKSVGLNPANNSLRADIDVVICTSGSLHLLQYLPDISFEHHRTNADPRFLGYECHQVLADALGAYDYFCYLEDDLLMFDSLFFQKLRWFAGQFGENALLQPNRYCIGNSGWKAYIEPISRPKPMNDGGKDPEVLSGEVMQMPIRFRRPANPHSGCFFLNASQMKRWSGRPYFMDRSSAFVGPLESAATLGITRTFSIYKPDEENAGFLEIFDAGARLRRQGRPLRDAP